MASRKLNQLEKAMRRAARRPRRYEDDFLDALGEATLVVPIPDVADDPQGRRIRAVFSSVVALQNFSEGAAYEQVSSAEAFSRFEGSTIPVVLNPGNEPFYEFSPDEIRVLGEGAGTETPHMEEVTWPRGHRLTVRLPAENPVELKQAISAVLRSAHSVCAAYLLEIVDEEEPRFFLGIEFDEADPAAMEEVMSQLDPVLEEYLSDGDILDAAMLNETSLLKTCRDVSPPFYRRSSNIPAS